MIRALSLSAVAAVAIAACSSPAPTTTTTAPTTTTTTTVPELPPQLAGWETTEIVLQGAGGRARPMFVAVADDAAKRQQGLMNVSDLADLDGMLFVFDDVTTSGFWMKDTLIPLDIAFFAGDGQIVDDLTMEPCPADPCPLYRPSRSYRYAVEVPAGGFAELAGDEVLSFTE